MELEKIKNTSRSKVGWETSVVQDKKAENKARQEAEKKAKNEISKFETKTKKHDGKEKG